MIAVTGAAGFIGSNLVWHLNQQGRRDLIVVDVASTAASSANLAPLDYAEYFSKEDFRAWLSVPANSAQLETVYHLGACSSTTETDTDFLAENNFGYTRDLCRLCLEAGVRFINASSAATYGDGGRGYVDDEAAIHRLEPLNPYGQSKQDFDLWAREQGALRHIVCLKYFNVFGPNEWHKGEMRSMVCKGFEQIQQTGSVKLFRSDRPEYQDGGQLRDFVYVKDAVAMTVWFAEHPEANGIYNVGTGQAHDWNRLMTAIFAALGRETNIEYISMPAQFQGKYQYYTEAVMTKARAAGFQRPFAVLEEAVADYVSNYLVPDRHLGA